MRLTEYGTVRLTVDLLKEVSNTITECKLWYNEVDFVREAVREKIASVKAGMAK